MEAGGWRRFTEEMKEREDAVGRRRGPLEVGDGLSVETEGKTSPQQVREDVCLSVDSLFWKRRLKARRANCTMGLFTEGRSREDSAVSRGLCLLRQKPSPCPSDLH